MKKIILSILFLFLSGYNYSQVIPADSLYLAQSRPGNTPVIFPLQSTNSSLRPVERISISSDGKEIYYSELNNWPPSSSRIKCYKYLDNRWQGPFVIFEGFVAPGLSMNDSTMYMQRDTTLSTGGVSWSYYSRRTSTGWSVPVKLLSTNMQTHYFQETQLKNYYLASTPGGNSDICKLKINNTDTTIQSLGIPINRTDVENDFFIARDESFLIFFRLSSPFDLFISYHKNNGNWTNPKSLGPNINTNAYECCPYVTSDNKYLFFTRGGSTMVSYSTYWVKIDNVIDSLKHTNFIPYVKTQIPDQADTINNPYIYIFPDSTFIDDDGNNTLRYSAKQYNGNPLPSWLIFDSTARKFYGTPTTSGTYSIRVLATDTAGASVSCSFNLNIINRVNINRIEGTVPGEYKLFQNYPNPFNPVTKINFSIPKDGFVTLKIYDMLGRVVETLYENNLKAGTYSIDYNSKYVSSGIYFYELKTKSYSEIKRMVLIK